MRKKWKDEIFREVRSPLKEIEAATLDNFSLLISNLSSCTDVLRLPSLMTNGTLKYPET